MPADFGDIAAYHREEAARHYAMAQAARDRDNFGEAEYQTRMAARWEEAAREQQIAMRQEPARQNATRRPNRRSPQPPQPAHIPGAVHSMSAVPRVIKRAFQTIHQSLHGRTAPIEGLSLR